MTSTWEPIACTLNRQDAEAQALEWVDLQGIATSSMALPTGAKMTFPAKYAARVADLAQRETTCCTFLAITTERHGEDFVMRVTSENPDGRVVISRLAGLDKYEH